MSSEGRRYAFPPLEQRGVILGLAPSQLALFGAGVFLAVIVIRALPNLLGLTVAAAIVAAGGTGCFWTIAGRSAAGWSLVVAEWAWRRAAGSQRSAAPGRGVSVTAELVKTELGSADLKRGGRLLRGRSGSPSAPAPAGIRLIDAPPVPGEESLGVIVDGRAGTYSAALAVGGRSFSLLGQSDKERRLAAWGAVLAGLCREGNPIHRLQWVERAVPGERHGLQRYLDEAATRPAGAARESYQTLVGGSGPVGQDHGVFLVVAVRARRSRRCPGGGAASACTLLRRELRLLRGQLDAAEVTVDGTLAAADFAGVIRAAYDHVATSSTRVTGTVDPPGWGSPWPMAADDGWSAYRSDGTWHVTYWVAAWPRIEVGPDFLSPLLLGGSGQRTVSVIMSPVAPAEAARQVEAARTADIADDQLRRRAGFLATARHRRQAEGVLRREAELAEGYGEFRFSGYVTVTVADRGVLDDACAETEQCARQANLELRRLYGQQQQAFSWTLPLARGLS